MDNVSSPLTEYFRFKRFLMCRSLSNTQFIIPVVKKFVFIEVQYEFYMHPADFQARETIESCDDLFMNGAKQE